MKRTVIRIVTSKYGRFMKIQLAKSGLRYDDFVAKIGVSIDSFYSRKHKKRVNIKHYETLKKLFGKEEGFDKCFSISLEEHGNTIASIKRKEKTTNTKLGN